MRWVGIGALCVHMLRSGLYFHEVMVKEGQRKQPRLVSALHPEHHLLRHESIASFHDSGTASTSFWCLSSCGDWARA